MYSEISKDFNASNRIPEQNFFINLFKCKDRSKARTYRKNLRKTRILMQKELDLQKFLHR